MLSFTAPWALLGLLAGLVVALFYFLRMRFRRQPVSSTFLWKRLIEVTEGGTRWRWRSLLLFLLQLGAVGALVIAWAGLQATFTQKNPPGIVYILDTSASMAAHEPGQEPRWSRAKALVLEDYRARDPGTPAVVFTGAPPVPTNSLAGVEGQVAAIGVGSGEFREGPAVEILTTWLQTHPGSWSGVLISDGGLDEGGARLAPLFENWKTRLVTDAATNLGIVDARVEADPAGIRITLVSGFSTTQTLTLAVQGHGATDQRTEVVAPGSSQVFWPLSRSPDPGLWTVSLPGHTDGLEADNSFSLAVDSPRRARVLHWGPPNPFLQAAFPGAVYEDRTGSEVGGPWDLVVTDGPEPEGWQGNLIALATLPRQSLVFWGPSTAGPAAAPTSRHPLSRWVPWSDLNLIEGRGLVVQPGVTVLGEAGGWPVAATWEAGGSKVLVLGFNTENSNLGLTPVLPVLMANFRQACVPQESNPLAANLRVGQVASRAGTPAWHVVSGTGASGTRGLEAVRRGPLWDISAREAGTYTWQDGSDSGVLVVSLPPSESEVTPKAPQVPDKEGAAQGSTLEPLVFSLSAAVALLALAFLVTEWRLWNGRFDPRSNRILGGFRVAAVALVVLAFGGLSLPWPTTDRNVVLLFDISDSTGPTVAEDERRAALVFIDQLAPTDRVALVSFAATTRVLAGWQSRDAARGTLSSLAWPTDLRTDQTDVGAALAAGSQLLRDQSGSPSQLLFTDGRTTLGGDGNHLSEAARRYPVQVVPVGRILGGVAGRALEMPSSVRPGEDVLVRWRAEADQPTSVVLDLYVDGLARQSQSVNLTTGPNTAEFRFSSGAAGSRRVEVQVRDAQSRPLPSAGASALLTVEGQDSILVVQGPGSRSLATALQRQGLPIRPTGPSGLPDTEAGYRGLSAVVLDNVPAPSLTETQQKTLKNWVSMGGGLFVVGGDSSLGRGNYFSSVLEDLLPVQTDQRQRLQFTRSRLLFVVDHSGSMGEEVGSSTKLEAALGGIARSLDNLTVQDEVGLLQFDSEADWVLPFTPMNQKPEILAALERFSQGGGTDLTKALDQVTEAFGRPGPVRRHVILMTDGQTGGDRGFFETFAETMRAAQVTMTVVGIGNDVNDSLLEKMAQGSDGVYYRARGDEIPSVLEEELVRVTRDVIQEGTFVPLTDRSPALDLGEPPPAVLGYLVTQAKPWSRVHWEVSREGATDPLYVEGRYGAGRVAVFTSDSGARWLAPWSGRPVYNRFWGQAVRSLERGPRDRGLHWDMEVSASTARLVVEAQDDAGNLRTGARLVAGHEGSTTPLTETAPGRYEAVLALDSPGLQSVTITDQATGTGTSAWAWNPPGAELTLGGADWAALGSLASATGGLLMPLAHPEPPKPQTSWTMVPLRDWLLCLALGLFLVELALRSTSLGQWGAAKTLFLTWWTAQRRPWARRAPSPTTRDEAEVERRTREAYKYLASRKRSS